METTCLYECITPHTHAHTFVTHSYTVHYREKAEEEEYLDTFKKHKDSYYTRYTLILL